MITEVWVSGYRSLTNLTIPVKPGLNVLVGPNGGGKTNILSFFELLTQLNSSQVDQAISAHGGIGRVFSRIPDNDFVREMHARIRGVVSFRSKSGRPKALWYTWEFCISVSETFDQIEYSKQKLYIDLESEPRNPNNSDLIMGMRGDESNVYAYVEKIKISKLQSLMQSFQFTSSKSYLSQNDAIRYLEIYSRGTDPARDSLVNVFPPHVEVFRAIMNDISGAKIYNFVPEICKQPDDSSRPPLIGKNGSGLASTLYSIERPQRRRSSIGRRFVIQKTSFKNIKQKIDNYIKLLSDTIDGIETKRNTLDNKISVFVNIRENDAVVSFPLAHCSDGTVKWIALVSTLMTAPLGFSIEEPENYLHPNVQKEFVNIVRAESSGKRTGFTLVTTHSESLLNEARPEEIILVWMDEGHTFARRLTNVNDIVGEINRTGFGLGYYYTTGGFESA